MSKQRQTNGVDIHIDGPAGYLWVYIRWVGKPRTELHGDFNFRARYADSPARRARLLKRARQMQDLLIGCHWYEHPGRILATGNKRGFTGLDESYLKDYEILMSGKVKNGS